jgi:hypothetical protein
MRNQGRQERERSERRRRGIEGVDTGAVSISRGVGEGVETGVGISAEMVPGLKTHPTCGFHLSGGEGEKPFGKELGRTDGPDWTGCPGLLGPKPFFSPFFYSFLFSLFLYNFCINSSNKVKSNSIIF